MISSFRDMASARQTRLCMASLAYFVARLLLVLGLVVGPGLIWRLGWPVLPVAVGAGLVVVLGFLAAHLVAAPLRCVVCSQASLGRSSQPKHPYAAKWLGISYPARVAWDVLAGSHHHCMYCHTRCRNRAYADQANSVTESRFRQPQVRTDSAGFLVPVLGPAAGGGKGSRAAIFDAALLSPEGAMPPPFAGSLAAVAPALLDPVPAAPVTVSAPVPVPPEPVLPRGFFPEGIAAATAPPAPFAPSPPIAAMSSSALPLSVPAFPLQSSRSVPPPLPVIKAEAMPPMSSSAAVAPVMPSLFPEAVGQPLMDSPAAPPAVVSVPTNELSPFFEALRPPVPETLPGAIFMSHAEPFGKLDPPPVLPPDPGAVPSLPVASPLLFPPVPLPAAPVFPSLLTPVEAGPLGFPPGSIPPLAEALPSAAEVAVDPQSPTPVEPFWLTKAEAQEIPGSFASVPLPAVPPSAVMPPLPPSSLEPASAPVPPPVSMEAVIRVLQQGQETMEAAFRTMIEQLRTALEVSPLPSAPVLPVPMAVHENAPNAQEVPVTHDLSTLPVVQENSAETAPSGGFDQAGFGEASTVPLSEEPAVAESPPVPALPLLSPLVRDAHLSEFPIYPPLHPIEPAPFLSPAATTPEEELRPLDPEDVKNPGGALPVGSDSVVAAGAVPVRRRMLPALPPALLAELGPTLAQAFIPAIPGDHEMVRDGGGPPEPPVAPSHAVPTGASPAGFSMPAISVPMGNSFVPGLPAAASEVPPPLPPTDEDDASTPPVPPPFSFLQPAAPGPAVWATEDLADLPHPDGPPMWTRNRGKPSLS